MPQLPAALPRRTVLTVSGTALLAACAACTSTPTSAGTATTNTTSTSPGITVTAAVPSLSAGTGSSSAEPGAGSAGSGSTDPRTSSAIPTGVEVANVTDIPDGSGLVVNGSKGPVLLGRKGSTVTAWDGVCTHQQCALGADGKCPCHGSSFDPTTGAVLTGPATDPLAAVTVQVTGDKVYLT